MKLDMKTSITDYGVCSTQEGMMLISMDENIYDLMKLNLIF